MREKLKAWLWGLLGLENILNAQKASLEGNVGRTRTIELLVDHIAGLERRIAALETAPSILPQLQADIRLVQEARREIEALRHEMAQRPGVIKTRTASEFRKQMEAINGR